MAAGLVERVEDGVAFLTLDRPEKLNALSPEMYAAIRPALRRADLDDRVDVIVLGASGDEAFCTGGDLVDHASSWRDDLPGALADVEGAFPYETFERISKVVICAINGKCQAAGMIMLLMSDLVVSSDRARFRVPEALVGLADPFVPVRLAQHVGLARARWMMFTAEEVDAHEAERIGLLGKVVPHDELEKAVTDVVERVRRTAPGARSRYKRMLNDTLPPVRMDHFLAQMQSPEALEGLDSFAEKRPPSWRPERA
jgi:enoyl-CoA hydratase/carnithine racemase